MKPILFNTEMVRAILDGRKTVTRRVVKPKFRPDEASFCVVTNKHTGEFVRIEYWDEYEEVTRFMPEPYRPGDILYVRETWRRSEIRCDGGAEFFYYSDGASDASNKPDTGRMKWRPSIHMPREAARIFLRVTDVRVERLQEIKEDGAQAEGLCVGWSSTPKSSKSCSARQAFMWLWDSTIKPADRERYGWAANPFCWVIEFEKCEKPVCERVETFKPKPRFTHIARTAART